MNIQRTHTQYFVLLAVSIALIITGCSAINNAAKALRDMKNLEFKLGKAENFSVNSVNISNIKSVSDISITDGLRLTSAVANKSLPTTFTLNVIASNPNKVATNTTSSSNYDAIVSSIDWVLLIDDKETINGRVSNPIKVQSNNQTTIIPVGIGLDLYKFFSDKGYADIMNLALAVGGANGSTSRLKLKMKPTVSVAGFPISYPNYITVVDKEFRGK